mgnify:CR=1 FL=1
MQGEGENALVVYMGAGDFGVGVAGMLTGLRHEEEAGFCKRQLSVA